MYLDKDERMEMNRIGNLLADNVAITPNEKKKYKELKKKLIKLKIKKTKNFIIFIFNNNNNK